MSAHLLQACNSYTACNKCTVLTKLYSICNITGLPITEEALADVREVSGVMDVGEDFIDPDVRRECERIIPEIDQVKPCDAADTYIFLKHHYVQQGNSQ